MAQKTRRITSDGLSLAVEVFGKGSPFLFAHGLGSCHHYVRRMLEPLAERYQIIAFDQRGHCSSTPVTDPALYDAQRMAGDIAAVLDYLGIEKAIVAGESMGAATALLFATQQPKRVQHLLQIAPTVADEANPGRDMITALADFAAAYGLEAAVDAAMLAALSRGLPRSAPELVTAYWKDHELESFVAANRAVTQWVLFESLAPVAALRMPIGVFAWGGDPSRPLSLARRLAAAGRHTRLETVASIAEIAADTRLYAAAIRRLLDEPPT